MFEQLPKTALDFKNSILGFCLTNLKLTTLTDNYDHERTKIDGVDSSKIFNVRQRIFWLSWFYENHESLFSCYEKISSENSKRLYINIICYRIAGHHSVRINASFSEQGPDFEEYLKIEGGRPSSLPLTGFFGSLTHYDFSFKGHQYIIDCLGLKPYLFRRQYFLNEGINKVQPSTGDYVIDAGACLGDTAVVFAKAVGSKGKVYAFDPVEEHLNVLDHNIKQNPECNIVAMPYGVSDSDVDGPPLKVGNYAPGFNLKNKIVPLRTLDTLVIDGLIPKIDFIKMDIEGSEMAALRGATGSIRKFRPKMAISLYHKPNDLYEIPNYIKEMFPFYEIFIGHYTIHHDETVLYCSPSNKKP